MSLSTLDKSGREHAPAAPAHSRVPAMKAASATPPAVIVLGGSSNALAIARSLGRRGVHVYLSAAAGRHIHYSRYCAGSFPYDRGVKPEPFWEELLLGPRSEPLHGSVIFACNDEAVHFVARRQAELSAHYRLGDLCADVQLAMLDKQKTLSLATGVDIPAPRFCQLDDV